MTTNIIFSPEEREGIILSLNPKYENISDQKLYDVVLSHLDGLTDEQTENFFRTVARIGQQALPGVIQGATAGSALGPYGAIIGGLAGGTASVLSSRRRPQAARPSRPQAARPSRPQAARPSRPQAARPSRPQAARPSRPGSPTISSPIAAQLLQLLQNPQLLQSLTALMMGSARRESISVLDEQVPIEDFVNLLSQLSESVSDEVKNTTKNLREAYVLNSEDNLDPAHTEDRNIALMGLLESQEESLKINDLYEDDLFDSLEDEVYTLYLK